MLTIKLNENTNSGMLYAIAYCEDPDIYSEDFWGWDTESDVGYELMEFGSLIQDADVFDSLEAAEDRADDVLSSIFEDEVFIVGLDPYTPHNLTGFIKKIIRDSINESKSINEEFNIQDYYNQTLNHYNNISSSLADDYDTFENGVELAIQDLTDESNKSELFRCNNREEVKTFTDKLSNTREYDTLKVYPEVRSGYYAVIDYLNRLVYRSKSIKESAISRVEPVVKFRGKSSHTFTPDKKWEIDFDEEGNVLARTRHGKPYYFSGHINNKTNEFGHTDEDAIIQAARKQHKLKFGKNDLIKDKSKSIKESSDSGYWYFTKHGVQPGSIPKGANVLTIQDVENGTYVKLDRVLTAKELNDYEIIEKRPEGLDESKSIGEVPDANIGYNPEYSSYIEEIAQRIDAGEYDDTYEVCEYVAKKFNKDINTVKDDINKLISDSKFVKESTITDSGYIEVAYICDGFTNFRVYGGGFKTSDALVAVKDEKGKRLRLPMGDVCEFYTWYDAKGNVIHEPTYYSED